MKPASTTRQCMILALGVVMGLAMSLFLLRPQQQSHHMRVFHTATPVAGRGEEFPVGMRAGLQRMRMRQIARQQNITIPSNNKTEASRVLDLLRRQVTVEQRQRDQRVRHSDEGEQEEKEATAAAAAAAAAAATATWQEISPLLSAAGMSFSAEDSPEDASGWCQHIRSSDVSPLAPYFDFYNSTAMVAHEWASTKEAVLRRSEFDKAECSISSERPSHVFGIGLSKTGTSSLGLALRKLGYKNGDMWTKFWRVVDEDYFGQCNSTGTGCPHSRGGFWSLSENDISHFQQTMLRELGRTKSTTDLPVAAFFYELARSFPDAAFILTTRDVESWARSAAYQFRQVTQNRMILRNRNIGFGTSPFHHHIYRKNFIAHYKAALRAVPCCRLLVMNIVEKGDAWDKLCPFLNIEIPKEKSFPWYNPRDTSTITRTTQARIIPS